MDDKKEERLSKDIDEISRNIRKKYRALKLGIQESDDLLTKSYKPILEPLKMISQKLGDSKQQPPVETIKVKQEEEDIPISDDNTFTPVKRRGQRIPSSASTTPAFITTEVLAETTTPTNVDDANVTLEDVLATPEGRQSAQEYVENLFNGPLARKYLHMSMSDERQRLMDHTYGVRHVNNKWMVGDTPLEIDQNDDDFYIGEKKYKGTPGLYELLFMKHPARYTKHDLKEYKSILAATNAHKQYHLPGANVIRNKSQKYKEIIAPLFPPSRTRSGRGHTTTTYMVPKTSVDYVHWDDPNELVERLKLLKASQRSGHTGHNNEIVSIVEELREAGVIV